MLRTNPKIDAPDITRLKLGALMWMKEDEILTAKGTK